MKTAFTFTFLLGFILLQSAEAQWIQNISVQPPNPTANDIVSIAVNSNFPSGGCDQSTQFLQINGNIIDAYTIHCLGVLSFICNDSDTFFVGQLPAGNYTFRLQLDMGGFPAPCTPGIIPMQTDSISFIVDAATGIEEHISSDDVLISPNPASDFISVNTFNDYIFPVEIHIFSIEGKKCGTYASNKKGEAIDVRQLPSGLYQIQLVTSDRSRYHLPLLINR